MDLCEKVDDINKRLKALDGIFNIAIWGAGLHTNKLLEMTDMLSYDLKYIVDIDARKRGNLYFGYVINSPEKLDWDHVGAVVVSVPNKEEEIRDELVNKLKFGGDIITLYEDKEVTPFYRLHDEKMQGLCCLGDYDKWEDAANECRGYEDKNIADEVINASNKVLSGEAAWERDGTLFYEPKYVYHICAAILRCAIQNNNQGVRVLDIGGALGSTYFQNRQYLTDIRKLEYVIVEQDHLADYGHKNLENTVLKFVRSTDDWENYGKFDIILMSGSIQYIENYEEIISKIIKLKPCYIIMDRIMVSNRMRICKQIAPSIVSGNSRSYPIRIFGEDEILHMFRERYRVVENDVSSVFEETYFIDGKANARWYVFEKISENNECI